MRKTLSLALFLLAGFAPVTASAGVQRVKTQRVYWVSPGFNVANAAVGARYVYPLTGGGRLVDVIVYQVSAGSVGTSWSVDVRNAAGTSVLSAVSVATQASGASQVTDALGNVALPSGWTRPAIKTDTTPNVTKGGFLDVYLTEVGSYSSHPVAMVVLVFQPNG
jgi:hypothetical protein